MDLGAGDPGRLQHIHDTIAKGKRLYHSDQVYLETKLQKQLKNEESAYKKLKAQREKIEKEIKQKHKQLESQQKNSQKRNFSKNQKAQRLGINT